MARRSRGGSRSPDLAQAAIRTPDALPLLARGHHDDPGQGACLMEYVSVLAGEPFSDQPTCVDPLLTRLAWTVNDQTPADRRAQLAVMAPRFIGLTGLGPLLAPSVVGECCCFVIPLVPSRQQLALERIQERSDSRIKHLCSHRPRRRPATDWWFRLSVAEGWLRHMAEMLARADSQRLEDLLDVALVCAERLAAGRSVLDPTRQPESRGSIRRPARGDR